MTWNETDLLPAIPTSTRDERTPPQEFEGATAPKQDVPVADPDPTAAGGSRLPAGTAVVHGALLLLSTQPITWLVSLATVMLLPHYLSAEDLGELWLALAVVGIASTVATWGVPSYLSRAVAADPERAGPLGSAALGLLVVTGLLVGGVLMWLLPALGVLASHPDVLRLALVGLVIGAPQSVLLSVLNGQERHAHYAWLSATSQIVTTAACLPVLAKGGSLEECMVAGLVVTVLIVVVGWYTTGFRLQPCAISPRLWGELLRGGFPFMGWNLTLMVRGQGSVVMTGVLLNASAIGWWAAASRIAGIPIFAPTVLMKPLLPALTRVRADRLAFQEVLGRTLCLMLLLIVPANGMIIALAPAIPDLLGWGPGFANAVPVMAVLTVACALAAVDMILGTALVALCDERRWLGVAVLAAVAIPALSAVLIPVFEARFHNGATGAAVAEVITESIMLGGACFLLPAGVLSRASRVRLLRILICGVCLVTVAALSRDVSPWLAIAAGGATFVLAAVVLGILRWSDLRTARDTVRQVLASRASPPVPAPAVTPSADT
ncbi:MAG TPA: oligosaccharide flippase family protein [Chloroflexota bacterium]|nr:oligosaccharide flippase family protein [Chloroflexota bacterium]